jgi:hypothetical protein
LRPRDCTAVASIVTMSVGSCSTNRPRSSHQAAAQGGADVETRAIMVTPRSLPRAPRRSTC